MSDYDASEQPLPIIDETQPTVHELVARDIMTRQAVGIQRYGTPLRPHNGRDVLVDIYEELLDAAAYMQQLMQERDKVRCAGCGHLADVHDESEGCVFMLRMPTLDLMKCPCIENVIASLRG